MPGLWEEHDGAGRRLSGGITGSGLRPVQENLTQDLNRLDGGCMLLHPDQVSDPYFLLTPAVDWGGK
jgi:hypothetical protein